MRQIFLSYRHDDTRLMVDRLVERLRAVLGNDIIFRDVDGIPGGEDFRKEINESMHEAKVCLVMIGPQWLNAMKDGQRRLDDPTDTVRIEIESAYRNNVSIIPVLVQNATMPESKNLPESINQLSYQNAVRLRSDPDFNNDFNFLITTINHYIQTGSSKPEKGGRSPLTTVLGAAVVILAALLVAVLVLKPNLPLLTGNSSQTRGSQAGGGTIKPAASMAALIPSSWHEVDDPLQDNSKGYNWEENSLLLSSCSFTTIGYAAQGSIDTRCLARTATNFTDYAFQVELQMSISTGGGIDLHTSDNGGYYFTVVNMDGTQVNAYFKSFDSSGTYKTLKTVAFNDLNIPFNKGKADFNTLGVVARGNTYTCFINGVQAAQVTDSNYPQGFMGIAGGYYHDRIYVQTFARNAKIWTP